ncbi:hypothetical protein R3P38DRAFT_3175626 [Favolaschia claudopus]|uniref:Uncharacterized protein n=1 Tax=Favolaschia claudopus TaxID=2862362 RepID=A0AAW0D1L5_9AGAR
MFVLLITPTRVLSAFSSRLHRLFEAIREPRGHEPRNLIRRRLTPRPHLSCPSSSSLSSAKRSAEALAYCVMVAAFQLILSASLAWSALAQAPTLPSCAQGCANESANKVGSWMPLWDLIYVDGRAMLEDYLMRCAVQGRILPPGLQSVKDPSAYHFFSAVGFYDGSRWHHQQLSVIQSIYRPC